MAKKVWLLLIGYALLFGSWGLGFDALRARAIYDPLSVPNNRYGVHILEPGEINDAAKLVNSSGGDWGYVTVPIRSNDRDREKWLTFFKQSKNLHLIPIVRLSTYPDGDHWVSPTSYDLVDFANFLSDMPWPTKNRYIVLFNEPNHSNEWGDYLSPMEYSTLVIDAHRIFKSRSEDYYLLSAGLDMSAPTTATSLDALEFYRRMSLIQPDWYKYIDGLSVHAYPNPAFSASPYSLSRFGITSFRYELKLLSGFGYHPATVFITETGSLKGSEFYQPAFSDVWLDKDIVAITPFVLFAGTGDFTGFSLLDLSHQPTSAYQTIYKSPKFAGSPLLSVMANLSNSPPPQPTNTPVSVSAVSVPNVFSRFFQMIFPESPQLTINQVKLSVEIADNPKKRVQGLSGRKSLPENSGMLFIFNSSQLQPFWMKDMKFPLDFVWINDGKVVELTENVSSPSQTHSLPQVVLPSHNVDQVLEVNAGFIKNHGIKVGDAVTLSRNP